jgi:hypothetical protein
MEVRAEDSRDFWASLAKNFRIATQGTFWSEMATYK